MATITKRDLSNSITEKLLAKGIEVNHQLVFDVVQAFTEEVADNLAAGNSIIMRKFGTFEVREMKAKIGRNPKDPSKDVAIPARAGIKFKPGKEIKDRVSTALPILRGETKAATPKKAAPKKATKK